MLRINNPARFGAKESTLARCIHWKISIIIFIEWNDLDPKAFGSNDVRINCTQRNYISKYGSTKLTHVQKLERY